MATEALNSLYVTGWCCHAWLESALCIQKLCRHDDVNATDVTDVAQSNSIFFGCRHLQPHWGSNTNIVERLFV